MGLGHPWRPHPCPIENTRLLRAAHRRRHDPSSDIALGPSDGLVGRGRMFDLAQASRLRPIPLVPACGLRSKGRDQARPTHTSNARSLHHTPHPNRLWWQSRSALEEALARAAPLPSLPCAWESASIMRHDSQTSGLRRSGLTLSLSSQLLDDFVQGRGLGLLGSFIFVLTIG